MLTFNQLSEKKSKIKINPKQADLKEKVKHGEDCECKKCDDRRDKEEPTVESVEVDEMHVTASMGRHAKKWREEQAEKQRRKDNPKYYAELDKIRAAKAKRAAKKEKNLASNMKKEELELEEERSARKMNVRTKGTIKKQIAKDAAAEAKRRANKTGEYKEKPKKKVTLKKPSQLTKVTGASKPEPKKEAPKPKAKPAAKKAAPKPKAKPVAAAKKVTPKAAPKKSAPKAKAKPAPKKAAPKPVAKKAAPKKKSGLGDRLRDAVKQGVKRHRKATQGARVFAKGAAKGAKDTVKFAGKVKKVFTGEGVTFKSFIKEATRLKKEKGYDKGGTKKPSGKKDAALSFVLDKIRKEHGKGAVMTGGSRQQKKVKGAKSTAGTGKYKKAADQKKQTAADAKKRGFKSSKDYVNTMARYGGKDNYDKGKGLGT